MPTLTATLLNSQALVNDKVFIGVMIDTVQPIVGCDISLYISPRLKFLNYFPTSLIPVTPLYLYENNRIKFSKLFSPPFNQAVKGLIAVIECQALSVGRADIKFDFTLGSTIDCNISSPQATDILTAVENRRLTIL